MLIIKSDLVLSYCVIYLYYILSHRISSGAKVKRRFNMKQLQNTPIRAIIPDNPVLSMNPKVGNADKAGQDSYRIIRSMFGVFNITETFIVQADSGVPDEYGNYTGLIGMVQRNETDLMFFMVRPDALPFEPVHIGAVYGSDEMVLLASRQPAKPNKLDLARLFSNFDDLTYCYLAFCTYLVVVVSTVSLNWFSNCKTTRDERLLKWIAVLKHAYTYCWSILELLVDQENYHPIGLASELLWLSYCIVAFVLIFGFFTNLLSTDLVAFIKPPELNSLNVLFTPYFEPVQPVVVTNLPSYSLIKNAESSTQLGALYQRLTRNTDISLLSVQLNDSSRMLSRAAVLYAGIASGQLCLATTDYVVTLMRLGTCGFRPANWRGVYLSTAFAQGLMTSYYNKALPEQVSRFIDYKNRNVHEMAIFGHSLMSIAQSSMADIMHEELKWPSFKCFHGLNDQEHASASDIQLTLRTAEHVFQYVFYALGLAMLVFLVECVMHLMKMFIGKCKTRARTNSVQRKQRTRITRDAQKWASMQAQLTSS